MGVNVEGVIEEHQESFQEWRYRESGKNLPVILGVLSGTLQIIIETHDEEYGEEIREEENEEEETPSPEARNRAMEYHRKVLMPKPS